MRCYNYFLTRQLRGDLKWIALVFFSIIGVILGSCNKYLNEKPDKRLAIPSTYEDLQMLLDDYQSVNSLYPSAAEVMSDNYFITDAHFAGLTDPLQKRMYLWQPDDLTTTQWLNGYQQILTFNTVLDNIDKVSGGNKSGLEVIRGEALFLRSIYFLGLAEIFGSPYNKSTAETQLSIVLRLNSNFNEKSVRATVKEVFDKILSDLKVASELLPAKITYKTRPSRAAAFGLLARTYLTMRDYDNAELYSDKCLALYDTLLNFSEEIDVNAPAPFARFNKEVIFHIRSNTPGIIVPGRAKIDTSLISTYQSGDLRKLAFFRGNSDGITFRFKGDYDGTGAQSGYVFAGVVTDEIYLIKAECAARKNRIVESMSFLNKLVMSRWDKNFIYIPIEASTSQEATQKILKERRKELLFRGLRWSDLRRLQFESDFAIVPKRIIEGVEYQLPINSPRYMLLIPRSVIEQTGIQQNP